jgi:hypothetical protein
MGFDRLCTGEIRRGLRFAFFSAFGRNGDFTLLLGDQDIAFALHLSFLNEFLHLDFCFT